MHNRARMLTLALATTVAGCQRDPDITNINVGTHVQIPTTNPGGGTNTGACPTGTNQELRLNPMSGNGASGTTLQLTATVNCGQMTTVTWRSDNNSVATVSASGLITFGSAIGSTNVCAEMGTLRQCGTYNSTGPATSSLPAVLSVTIPQTIYNHSTCSAWGNYRIQPTVNVVNNAGQGVVFSSTNRVSTVNANGDIVLRSPAVAGTDTIVVAATADPTKTATVYFTVSLCQVPLTGINLSQTSVSLIGGQGCTSTSTTIGVTPNPSTAVLPNLIWTSSNSSVASVSGNGTIAGVAPGTAVITVSGPTGQLGTVNVTVSSCTVNPTGLNLSQTSLNLQVPGCVGSGSASTGNITASPIPATAVLPTLTWSSNNTSVATVNNGFISGVGQGSAVITVTGPNGLHGTVNVTVSGCSYSVKIQPAGDARLIVGQFYQPSAVTTPANQAVTWSSSNGAVASVDGNGRITALSPGTTTVCARLQVSPSTQDCIGVTVSPQVTAGISLSPPSGSGNRGTTMQVVGTVTGQTDNRVIYFSSDPSRVGVGQQTGLITFVFTGEAIICAQSVANANLKACGTFRTNPPASLVMSDEPKSVVVPVIP